MTQWPARPSEGVGSFVATLCLHREGATGSAPSLRPGAQAFLFPSLRKAWDRLTEQGHLAVHLVDINPSFPPFTEVTNLFIGTHLPQATYRGVVCAIGERGRNRPIWVWRKAAAAGAESAPAGSRIALLARSAADCYPEVTRHPEWKPLLPANPPPP